MPKPTSKTTKTGSNPADMPTHTNKKDALAWLAANPLGCPTWMEGKILMSAIYWNDTLRTQPANQKIKW